MHKSVREVAKKVARLLRALIRSDVARPERTKHKDSGGRMRQSRSLGSDVVSADLPCQLTFPYLLAEAISMIIISIIGINIIQGGTRHVNLSFIYKY